MASARLPVTVPKRWSALKNKLTTDLDLLKLPIKEKVVVTNEVLKLYRQFDQGLSPKLKLASSSTTADPAAKSALADVVRIATSYETKLDEFCTANANMP